MATLRSLEISSQRSSPARAAAGMARLGGLTKFAWLTVVFGWFFMHTLVVSIGSLQHGVRFFDMTAVIADPTRLFFNVDTTTQRVAFGIVCAASLLAPVIAAWRRSPAAWAYHLAPLILMLVCGAVLYATHGADLESRHISVAAGGYWAFVGCVLLAVQGVRSSRLR